MTPTRPAPRRAALITAILAGLAASGVAGFMMLHHLRAVGDPFYNRVCNPSSSLFGLPLDCEEVAQSAFGQLFGIPISVVGLAFYLVLVGLALVALRRKSALSQRATTLLWGGALFAVAYALWLFGAQLFVIRAICPFCLTLYTLHLLLFGAVWVAIGGAWRQELVALGVQLRTAWREPLFLGALGIFVVLTATGAALTSSAAKPQADVGELVARIEAQPSVRVPASDGDGSLGATDAPYEVIEYSDFLCPFCREAATDLHRLLRRDGSAMHVRFKHYPLDADCNPYVLSSIHPGACLAAAAAICAGQDGKFWPMHDWLFANAHGLAPEALRQAITDEAKELGLDESRFASCLGGDEVQADILDDIESAVSLGVRATPAFVLNGKPLYRKPLAMGAAAVDAIGAVVRAGALKRAN